MKEERRRLSGQEPKEGRRRLTRPCKDAAAAKPILNPRASDVFGQGGGHLKQGVAWLMMVRIAESNLPICDKDGLEVEAWRSLITDRWPFSNWSQLTFSQ